MKLKNLIPLVGNCHLTIWRKDGKGCLRVVAQGFSRNDELFAGLGNAKITMIRPSYNGTLSITVE